MEEDLPFPSLLDEGILGAPKIMSGYQLSDTGKTVLTTGIHLLKRQSSKGENYYQLIFGTSALEAGLDGALNASFAQLRKIMDRREQEIDVLDGIHFSDYFGQDLADSVHDIIFPDSLNKSGPITAFGVFIGYQIHVNFEQCETPTEVQEAIENQIRVDIESRIGLIRKLLCDYGLIDYSIYLYLLPFDDLDKEKAEIINGLQSW